MDIFSSFALKVSGMPVRPGISSALPAGGQVALTSLGPFLSNCCFWRKKRQLKCPGREEQAAGSKKQEPKIPGKGHHWPRLKRVEKGTRVLGKKIQPSGL